MAGVPAPAVERRAAGTCCGGRRTYAYRLPVRLDASILQYIQSVGISTLPFEKWRILRLEGQSFTVTGIKGMKEIRVSLEASASEDALAPFEAALAAWISQTGT